MSKDNLTGFTQITDHGLLLLQGPDAHKFLQGQVSSDIDALSFDDNDHFEGESCLGAHCNHKGRMLFSFRACQINKDTIALSIFKPLLDHALQALKKYSVFSKVELINAEQDFSLYGFIGENTQGLEEITTHLPSSDNLVTHHSGGTVIKLSQNKYEIWLPKSSVKIPETSQLNIDLNTWQALSIADGIGEVRNETVEEFIPQMLNLQEVGNGISFKKGCYTGQEVVARMQYLGKLKKRMFRLSLSRTELIPPGTPLFSKGSSNSIGTTVISALTDSKQELLAVVNIEAVDDDNIYLDDTFQQKLQALPLPYAITKE